MLININLSIELMLIPFHFTVNSPSGAENFSVEPGSSLLIVGANGSGKTRLAVHIESLVGIRAHRISAHRALTLNTSVPKISESNANSTLRTGFAIGEDINNRPSSRWQGQAATLLLNDYDSLIQSLFADQTNKSLITHQQVRDRDFSIPPLTKLEKLVEIWENLMPHRKLIVTGDNITVSFTGGVAYSASEMSDGERAIFYLIGQVLCTALNTLLIVDEPELHVHKSIISKLWDELEGARIDCAFVFISHDLDFVASRIGKKYVIINYNPLPQWTFETVPEETGFSEEITTQILGSRRPILFIEGKTNSLDYAIYRNNYPLWTVIPCGSCEDVIHSVVSMRANSILTRIRCSGIVDADDHSTTEIGYLNTLGINVLKVNEIENIFLLPDVVKAIGEHEGHTGVSLEIKLKEMDDAILDFAKVPANLNSAVNRYCRRRIDKTLKKIDLSDANTIEEIEQKYNAETCALDIKQIAASRKAEIESCLSRRDIKSLLAIFDNKGLLAILAHKIKGSNKKDFEAWIVRVLGNKSIPMITVAVAAQLPVL